MMKIRKGKVFNDSALFQCLPKQFRMESHPVFIYLTSIHHQLSLSKLLYDNASFTCVESISTESARSAIVRASLSTLKYPRAEKLSFFIAFSSNSSASEDILQYMSQCRFSICPLQWIVFSSLNLSC